MRTLNAARFAYGLNSCEGFGFYDADCDVADAPHLVIFAEYNKDYLRLKVADAQQYVSDRIKSHVILNHLGVDNDEILDFVRLP